MNNEEKNNDFSDGLNSVLAGNFFTVLSLWLSGAFISETDGNRDRTIVLDSLGREKRNGYILVLDDNFTDELIETVLPDNPEENSRIRNIYNLIYHSKFRNSTNTDFDLKLTNFELVLLYSIEYTGVNGYEIEQKLGIWSEDFNTIQETFDILINLIMTAVEGIAFVPENSRHCGWTVLRNPSPLFYPSPFSYIGSNRFLPAFNPDIHFLGE